MGAAERDLGWLNDERQHIETITPVGLRGEQARMWTSLLDFSQHVTRLGTMDHILDQIIDTAVELTCSRRVSLMLPDETRPVLRISRAVGIDPEIHNIIEVPFGDAVAGKAFKSSTRITGAEPVLTSHSIGRYQGKAYVSVPILTTSMVHGPQCLGVLNITNRVLEAQFDDWELEFLDLFARMAGAAIDDLRWRDTRETMIKVERDLKLAREIQTAALPATLPALHGIQLAAWTEPAEHAGGDVYDIIGLPLVQPGTGDEPAQDRAIILVADVAGHGVGPALAASQTRAMVRTAVRMGQGIAEITRVMDEQLLEDLPGGRFVCSWLAELDASERTLRWVGAGLGDAILLHAGGKSSERLPAACPPLGLGAAADVEAAETVELQTGDIVAIVSDGITEAMNDAGKQFGIRGVQAVLSANHTRTAQEILAALRTALDNYTGGAVQADDRTAVIIRAA